MATGKRKEKVRFPLCQPLYHETYLQAKHRQRDTFYHYQNIANAKPYVDAQPPKCTLNVRLKLKKLLAEGQRLAAIERDNRHLLERIIQRMKGPAYVDHYHKGWRPGRAFSLGYEARMREVKKINDENRRMLDRILATCTSYDHIKMELEYQVLPDPAHTDSERRAAFEDQHKRCFPQYFGQTISPRPVPKACLSPPGSSPVSHARCYVEPLSPLPQIPVGRRSPSPKRPEVHPTKASKARDEYLRMQADEREAGPAWMRSPRSRSRSPSPGKGNDKNRSASPSARADVNLSASPRVETVNLVQQMPKADFLITPATTELPRAKHLSPALSTSHAEAAPTQDEATGAGDTESTDKEAPVEDAAEKDATERETTESKAVPRESPPMKGSDGEAPVKEAQQESAAAQEAGDQATREDEAGEKYTSEEEAGDKYTSEEDTAEKYTSEEDAGEKCTSGDEAGQREAKTGEDAEAATEAGAEQADAGGDPAQEREAEQREEEQASLADDAESPRAEPRDAGDHQPPGSPRENEEPEEDPSIFSLRSASSLEPSSENLPFSREKEAAGTGADGRSLLASSSTGRAFAGQMSAPQADSAEEVEEELHVGAPEAEAEPAEEEASPVPEDLQEYDDQNASENTSVRQGSHSPSPRSQADNQSSASEDAVNTTDDAEDLPNSGSDGGGSDLPLKMQPPDDSEQPDEPREPSEHGSRPRE
ncbi:hypothetical protein BaRGS_00028332 [Batillaria attramentaria]|uniref:Uncharacterized protein n=1 Tax=Batillaria attramentaria TaxID=370345 RepID=A0ABD0K029_9CAEN